MKIIKHFLEDYERLYCPSTGEVIQSIWNETLNYDAKGLMALWSAEGMDSLNINDEDLLSEWYDYYETNTKDGRVMEWKNLIAFLEKYNNDDWIVYDCEYNISVAGTFLLCFVVKKDTIFEDDPDYTDDEYEEEIEEGE